MKFFNSSLIVLIVIGFSACNVPRYAYSPSAHNVPVLTQKGDGKIGALYSTNIPSMRAENEKVDDGTNGIDILGAYAISDNWAVQASHFQRWERTTGGPDSINIKYRRNLTELGVGYYFAANDKKRTFIQIFGGAGLGKFSITDHSKTGNFYHQSDILKFYIQPAILFRSKGSFSSSVAIRGSFIKFNSIKTNYSSSDLQDYKLDNITGGAKFFFEPAYVGSFGFKNLPGLRIEFQASASLFPSDDLFNYRTQNFSIGSYLDLGSLKRRTNKTE